MRLIDADRLNDELIQLQRSIYDEEEHSTYDSGRIDGLREALVYMKDAPAVDAAPSIPAHWISTEKETGENTWKCSGCGWELYLSNDDTPGENGYRYCPNCGARMEVTEC